jgi:hypothetical protein
MNTQYPSSPYYDSEMDLGYAHAEDLHTHNEGLFASSARSYADSPLQDAAYPLRQSPSESLFTLSPSPSAPVTPVSQGGWDEEVGLDLEEAFECGTGLTYQGYAG